MSTSAIFSKTLLAVATASGQPTLIPNVENIGGPNVSRELIDVSSMESTVREFKTAALPDNGTLSFNIQYVPSNGVHAYIFSQSLYPVAGNDRFKMTLSDGTIFGLTGSFSEFSINADSPVGIEKASVSVRLTGPIAM